MTERTKGLLWNLVLYAAAFVAGGILFFLIENLLLAEAAFTVTATLVIFTVTCFYPDTSLYDPYWSIAPPVMLFLAMLKYRLWNINSVLMLFVVCVWSLRLTANWYYTYLGLGHEDWRYRQYREKLGKAGFFLINLVGLQMVPTIVVYAGLIGAFFVIQAPEFRVLTIAGYLVMLAAVGLEYLSDHAIHEFLLAHPGERKSCDVSVWRYSRHPNYLGEMSFWTGIFIVYFVLYPAEWYYGLGFLSIIALFMFVSIPMMEKHNLERRPDYAVYREKTSRIFLLPPKS
ncbi:MAG: DUF1295 domain-containing protein [Lachnospiraceae bacterium]|nr:DUF1295 domain-containing protein [Lachnospiraceae bacterium]